MRAEHRNHRNKEHKAVSMALTGAKLKPMQTFAGTTPAHAGRAAIAFAAARALVYRVCAHEGAWELLP